MPDRNDAPTLSSAELDQLRESDRIFRALLDNAPVLISTKNLQGTVTMANRHFEILDGYDAATFVGSNVFQLFPHDIAEQLWRNDRRAALEKRAIHEEEQVYHRDKTLHTYATVKFPLMDADGVVYATCAVSADITDARSARLDSVTDELTGLHNRRYYNFRFREEQQRARRDQRTLTLLLADVDRFKEYNDTYGHPQGDTVLQAVAECMRQTFHRAGDLCFRIGGDEFACLFASSGEEESLALAEQLRACMAGRQIAHADNPPMQHVSLSLGLAFITPEVALTQEEIYRLADQALYRAKHHGRNTVSR
ncbi:PAS domain S-box-containing protein/diguanylate cyclase (GGDEF) domain-containing protein [Duganella sp. CF402]|uniref:sensor domain-containing diguanylate cyclase n=1 Tax=unclassified Duganella TaxID=2636909 RepID=UPI0008C8A16A|nr:MULTISPECIES: GGDEF domain-containing protein [unclassified Duganella]RZT09088.1 PAS domain S-box-containing protein/diguanylate cyclase (GGDEF)-like protein [Duganella sp. BK701]SEL70879.1 PAS domain S-box-containing protein/diguanylate cyclase (GGDEF) domain-containing protein [Duganella sp. CF402]